MGNTTCGVGDCVRPPEAHGYCHRHAQNFRTTGNPIPRRDWPLEAQLRHIGWTVTESGCWEWRGKRRGRTPETSYGIFNARRLGFQDARAHRVVYEHFVGPIPDGMVLRHSCDNPPCVNPDHLVPGTCADNSRDMVERRRHWRHDRAECDKGHDLTLPGAIKHGKSADRCAECDRERRRESEDRRRRALGVPSRRILAPDQVAEIRRRRAGGASLKELGADFGLSIQAISDICTGRSYPAAA